MTAFTSWRSDHIVCLNDYSKADNLPEGILMEAEFNSLQQAVSELPEDDRSLFTRHTGQSGLMAHVPWNHARQRSMLLTTHSNHLRLPVLSLATCEMCVHMIYDSSVTADLGECRIRDEG